MPHSTGTALFRSLAEGAGSGAGLFPPACPARPRNTCSTVCWRAADLAALLRKDTTHVYVCGLKGLEEGVDEAFRHIGEMHDLDWPALRNGMRESGRYHVETY